MDGLSVDPMFTNPDNGDFTLKEESPAKRAGTLGCDLGAYAVYPRTEVGRNANQSLSTGQWVSFNNTISKVSVGVNYVTIRLSSAAMQTISMKIVPVAGDARQGVDFSCDTQITFNPGEKLKNIAITIKESEAQHDQLLALKLIDLDGVQIGARSTHLIRIKRKL